MVIHNNKHDPACFDGSDSSSTQQTIAAVSVPETTPWIRSQLLVSAGEIASSLTAVASTVTNASQIAYHVLNETEGLRAIFGQLQSLLLLRTPIHTGRTAMIQVDQLVIMLTGCVVAFSELEVEIEGLEKTDEIRLWDRVKWGLKESSLRGIVERLAMYKMSLNLMLTVLLCHSHSQAAVAVDETRTQVEILVETNEHLLKIIQEENADEARGGGGESEDEMAYNQLEELPDSHCIQHPENPEIAVSPPYEESRTSLLYESAPIGGPAHLEFEKTLYKTRVYSRAARRLATNSFASLHTFGSHWSQLTGLSLAEISDISVLFLPICASGLSQGLKFDHRDDMLIGGSHCPDIRSNTTPQSNKDDVADTVAIRPTGN
ncbi:hypothetical protein K440DRAFT_636383 [Wilcoxina mikolae CBS 423.85]|nr:hypothetical protein K440DRAFT_636383 [Wilcoxina mikolae CBS 423.85]